MTLGIVTNRTGSLLSNHDHRAAGQLPVISLFSGAGGLDLAVDQCGEPPLVQGGSVGPLCVAVATDNDRAALETYAANFPTVPTILGDIRSIGTERLLSASGLRRGDPVLVVGGPPCTPFSKSGFWLEEKRTSSDPNASLLDEFVRVVDEVRPEAFILENVQGLTYKTHRVQFHRLLYAFEELGYTPRAKVLIAADFGVPQIRRRVFVVGRRDGQPFQFPRPTHGGKTERTDTGSPRRLPFITAGDAIRDLLPGESESGELVEGKYADLAAQVPPGGNYLWHTTRQGGQSEFEWRSRYWTFLLRLDPKRPSTTLQAQPGPWVGPYHWENISLDDGTPRARRLRIPEMLRLMTFPDNFRLIGDRRMIQSQLGNAVPVELGKVVIRALLEQLGHLTPVDQSSLRIDQLALPY